MRTEMGFEKKSRARRRDSSSFTPSRRRAIRRSRKVEAASAAI